MNMKKKKIIIMTAIFYSFMSYADIGNIEKVSGFKPIQSKVGSWGDQGDGTYINPILNADYPDSDIEQVGDTYYMITSKQHMSPGMPILQSKDMVNWETIGHGFEKLSWAPEYNWDRMNGYSFGVWAGDLAYHEGTWYIYQIDYKHGLMVTTAPDIRGPWSEPIMMLPPDEVVDDPAVFWDYDSHKAYMIINTGLKQKQPENETPGNENRIYEMSWDGKEILGESELVYTGRGAEAAKIYKIDDIWYIFLAEWDIGDTSTLPGVKNPKNDRKQIVLRSKDSIYGPYEVKTVLEKGSVFNDRSASQGSLLQAPDQSWWYMHQLIQNDDIPFQGRPQCLEPVNWVDGWPIIGVDTNNNGIGEPVKQYRKPINGFPIVAPSSDDDFSSSKLGYQWEWNHNPRDTHWSLTENPGMLRLKASKVLPNKDGYGPNINQWTNNDGSDTDFWRVSNVISQRIMGITTGTAIAKFDISGMEPNQLAGFARFGGNYNLLGVEVDDNGNKNLFYMDSMGNKTQGVVINSNDLFIKTTNVSNQAKYYFSFDGEKYESFGPTFTISFGKWTGDRLGFFTWNEKKDEEAGYIDVDWFTYDYDGPKG
ncbi:glycoside hydrolase 43 family protein [Photobacterium sp. ZSDE20]|uniref:Glycoside hydrolase 43 family protein n=1 Tax=Photobacterium pectinilyticum TaxID=2906793 RepID=A0ABT1N6B7_9GAMM|nr:glycoside hydrolase 43 family protein [Photobacterium sp. ZSDE20]MCQ1060290.1 glycoside hydrolase 43 family protein [Photobacterium sp. ZSDE20]MDD1827588.1 glycoside hydrolase 43 family protein [Photobacterium sp. ZSDE20]